MNWIEFALVVGVGAIIGIVGALAYFAGMRAGSSTRSTEDKADVLSLRGLSPESRTVVINEWKRRWIWEETRGPRKNLYRTYTGQWE